MFRQARLALMLISQNYIAGNGRSYTRIEFALFLKEFD
jgi:hypothetical protein